MSSENIIKKGIGGRIGQAALAGILAFTLMPFSGAGEASASTYDDGNITVSMPTTINYVARADGTLIAPSASALAFTNLSDWEVRVSSVKVTPADGWGIADNPAAAAAADPNGNNYVSLTMGPEDDQLNLADYINTPSPVTNNIAWTMAMPAKNEDLSTVNILTTGTVANVDALTAQSETIATTEWYLAADTTTDEVFTRIADLEAENATLTTNLATLQSSYDTLSANYTALESEVDTLGDSVSNLRGYANSGDFDELPYVITWGSDDNMSNAPFGGAAYVCVQRNPQGAWNVQVAFSRAKIAVRSCNGSKAYGAWRYVSAS